jgi:D-alanine transaminase
VPVYSRVPFRLDEHLARLERSLAAVRIGNPYSRAEWRDIILQLVAKQPFEDQGVYFQVTRGVAKRDHAFPKDAAPTVFIMSNPLVNPPQELVQRGAAAVTAVDDRWLHCDIKSISLIGNCLLRQASADVGALETILFRDHKLTEASASNVFVVHNGVILSPPKSNLILPGITYDVIAEIAQAAGLPLEYREISESEVRSDRDARRQAGGRRQAGPGLPPRPRALSGIQAEGHACGKGTASRLTRHRGRSRSRRLPRSPIRPPFRSRSWGAGTADSPRAWSRSCCGMRPISCRGRSKRARAARANTSASP